MIKSLDGMWMQRALALAEQGVFSTHPNPRVGCVLVKDAQIVGEGFHVLAGQPHAEVHALRQAGDLARGATAYVTLEPCSHQGRTGPCARALIEAGVSRVVCAMIDPNPLVQGQGLALLREAGIEVDVGCEEAAARELNQGFISRFERGRPFIRLKIAASLDGKTALSDGRSQWITSVTSRADVQRLRAQSSAILTGIGTVLADNPRLTVRDFSVLRAPVRIILDSQLRTPQHAHVRQDNCAPTWILHSDELSQSPSGSLTGQQPSSLAYWPMPCHEGRIDLVAAMNFLAGQGVSDLLLETGSVLSSAFLKADLVDEIILYQAPKILGEPGRSLFRLPENTEALHNDSSWRTHTVGQIGPDVRWILRKAPIS